MDNKDLMFLNEIENKLMVNRWNVNNIHVWPYIRMYFDAIFPKRYSGKGNSGRGMIDKIKSHLTRTYMSNWLYYRDFKNNDTIHKSDVVFLGGNDGRTVLFPQKGWADQFLDPVRLGLEERGLRTLFLECAVDNKNKYPRFSKSVLINNLIIMKQLEMIRWYCNWDNSQVELSDYGYLENLAMEYGVTNFSLSQRSLVTRIKILDSIKNGFKKILIQVEAKIGILYTWYNLVSMAFCLACREVGIPCIDVQHGLAGAATHIGYCGWTHVPIGGYNVMPSHFWCWSEKDAQAINHWYSGRAFCGGHPEALFKYSCFDMDYYEKNLHNIISKRGCKILLTLQPGVIYPEYLLSAIKDDTDNTWLVRCHPHFDYYQKMFIDSIKLLNNTEIDISTKMPLNYLLRKVDVHVTLISSVVLDALEYGVSSIILDDSDRMFQYKDLIRENQVFVSKGKDDLFRFIKNIYWGKKRQAELQSTNKYLPIDFIVNLISKRF